MAAKSFEFPFDQYLSALVKLLDTVPYRDENYDRARRLGTLRHVYFETAKHFAQPSQKDALKVHSKRMEAAMRTSVQLIVLCWVKLPPHIMVSLSIYFVYMILLDDSDDDPRSNMESFAQDIIHGREQKSTFWRLMNDHLASNLLLYYGGFCSLSIFRSTLDFYQGCWIETHNFQGLPGSKYFPLFLRRLNGLGGICGASLFPKANCDEETLFEEITTVVAQIEPVIALVNDMISFYKEFDTPRDQINLITSQCRAEGISIKEAFDRLTADTINCVHQLQTVFHHDRSPLVAEIVRTFLEGYVTWHFCDERYRMRELYQKVDETPDGEIFRRYFENTMEAVPMSVKEWSSASMNTDASKDDVCTTERLVSS